VRLEPLFNYSIYFYWARCAFRPRKLEVTRLGVVAGEVDLDRNENVLGIELIGVREFTISALLKRVPQIQLRDATLLGKTRYISAARATSQAKEDPDLAAA
jgi:hypothetical protein